MLLQHKRILCYSCQDVKRMMINVKKRRTEDVFDHTFLFAVYDNNVLNYSIPNLKFILKIINKTVGIRYKKVAEYYPSAYSGFLVTMSYKMVSYYVGFPECTDENQRCAEWAKQGECKANPDYMLVQCAKSCRVCDESKTGYGRLAINKYN